MGLLDDRKDDFLVQRLITDWKAICKLSPYVKPRIGAKTLDSAKEFVQLAGRLKKTPRELLEAAIGRYSPEWCKETFKTAYPPFVILVGKASRKWLAHELGQPAIYKATGKDLDKQAGEIVNTMLGTMTKDKALELVRGGWPTEDDLRAAVKKMLEA